MMKVKGVPFSQVKQKLLNAPEAVKGYEDADKELEMVEMYIRNERKSGVNKVCAGRTNGITPVSHQSAGK
ncbi:DNA-binding protein [Escherichia coli]|nr:DNA-binding protein [Escherichia coli]